MNAATPSFWIALENIRGLSGVAAVWRKYTGEDFERCRAGFLERQPRQAKSVPCPRGCGCWHEVVAASAPSESLRAVCRCDSWRCDDLELTAEEVVVWSLNRPRLGRALCRAFGLEPRHAAFSPGSMDQIGSWSADGVPVFLSLDWEPREFHAGVAELVARLGRPFILLAPTRSQLDAAGMELLERARAGFFDLSGHLRWTAQGGLEAVKTPGEIFARFQPQPREPLDEDLARRAFAVVRQLDDGETSRARPGALTVFRLYCIEELSAEAIARKFNCARATVYNRLEQIRRRTGSEPQSLRRLSAHLARIEEECRDPRARAIHRQSLIQEDDSEAMD
jgi:hypothetical protein